MPDMDLDARVAVLEERTAPKPKTGLDRFKEWSGVISVVLALGYSFPLGVWDRFIVSAQADREAKQDFVRDVAQKLTEFDSEFARSYTSIRDDQTRMMFGRAIAAKKFSTLERNEAAITANFRYLTAPEIVLLAYNFAQAGKFETAEAMYADALKKALDKSNRPLAADILRLQGQLRLTRGDAFDKARVLYAQGAAMLATDATAYTRLQASTIVFEWANGELTAGDWACGRSLAQWAADVVRSLPQNPETATYLAQCQTTIDRSAPRPTQPRQGCGTGLAPWLTPAVAR